MRRRNKPSVAVILGAVAVTALGILNLLPLLWGALTSIKPDEAILAYPPRLAGFSPTLEHYATVLRGSFSGSLLITTFYGVVTTVAGVVIAALAAYSLDRFEFPFRRVMFYALAASIPLAIGAGTLIVPNYLYFSQLGLTNQWFTLPLIYTGLQLPMAVWIMKGSIESVPKELDEAAQLDGSSRMGILFRVILPLCRPGLFAAGLLSFIGAWNEFVAGSVMVDSAALQPVQVAVYQYISEFGRFWGPLTAAALLAVIPIILAMVFMGKHLVSGLTGGSMKG